MVYMIQKKASVLFFLLYFLFPQPLTFFFFLSFFLPLQLPPPPFLSELDLLCTAPWVDCMWRGDVLITGGLLITPCTQTPRHFCSRVNDCVQLTKVPHIANSSPFFFPFFWSSKNNTMASKLTTSTIKRRGFFSLQMCLFVCCVWCSTLLFGSLIRSIGDTRLNYLLRHSLALFIHGWVAGQTQFVASATSACTCCVEDYFALE